MKIRFQRMLRATRRTVTPRRIAAAKRFLAKERERHALFADQVAEEQPTAAERLEGFDLGYVELWTNMRNLHACQWREARAILREWTEEHRNAFLARWNDETRRFRAPMTSSYFLCEMREYARKNGIQMREVVYA